jgi:hypothetical protein
MSGANKTNNMTYKDRPKYEHLEQQLSELQLTIPYIPNKNIDFPSVSIFPSVTEPYLKQCITKSLMN